VAVRSGEVSQRRTVEQERLQHAAVDDRDALGLHALVVVEIVPHQLDVADLLHGRIERDAQKRGQHRLSNPARKRLAIIRVALAVALDTVAENLMKENTRGAPGQDRRAREGLDDGRPAETREQIDHGARLGDELALVRQSIRRGREVAGIERELHAVFALVTPWMKMRELNPPVTIFEPSLLM
jgi:hypothetical protein